MPLGETLKVDQSGISNITNLITGYVTIEAENQERVAAFFRSHLHFEIFYVQISRDNRNFRTAHVLTGIAVPIPQPHSHLEPFIGLLAR